MAEVKATGATKALSSKLQFWYGFGDFGFTLMTNVETYYWNSFLTQTAGFSTAIAGTVTSISSIVDMVTSWIFGGIINAVKPGKHGRYRTWLILITWIVPFLYACEFIKFGGNDTVAAVIICIASILAHACWNFPYAANTAVMAVAGQTPEGRSALASSRATWNNLSGVVFGYAFQGLSFVIGKAAHYQHALAAFIFGIVMFIGYYVHFKITEGYEEIEDPNNPKATPKSATPKDWFVALSQNKYLCFLVIADLAKWVVKFLVAAAAVYYFSYVMGTNYQTNYVTFANIMGVIGAFLCRFIAKKLGNKNTLIASYIFMIVLFLVSYFSYKNATVVFVLMLIAQAGYGVAYASSPALYADCAVYSKWKTKKDTTGFIMGLQTLPLKIGVFVRSALLNAVLGAAGYDLYSAQISEAKNAGTLAQLSETLPDTLKQGVAGAFCLWAAIFCIIGVVLLVLFYKLDNKKVMEYQAEIDAREMAK